MRIAVQGFKHLACVCSRPKTAYRIPATIAPLWRKTMQNQSLMQSARDVVSRYWNNYRDRAESRKELAHMSTSDIEMLAVDCGLSPGQLRDMLARGPHAAD